MLLQNAKIDPHWAREVLGRRDLVDIEPLVPRILTGPRAFADLGEKIRVQKDNIILGNPHCEQ